MNTSTHPRVGSVGTLVLLVLLSVLGAIIGIELLTSLGVTPNTSIIGALVAMIIARIPMSLFARFRSIHEQNLAQTAISSATFGAANSLLLPIAVPYLMGRTDLVIPMFIGVGFAMLLDAYMLYRLFDSRIFPASGAWPPGVAAAEAIKAGDGGGKQAKLLGAGIGVGVIGAWLHVPMSAFGIAFLGNIWALTMFGIGLLIRGYAKPIMGWDINALYIPHGLMVGAGLVALIQVAGQIWSGKAKAGSKEQPAAAGEPDVMVTRTAENLRRTLRLGSTAYIVLAALLALGSGLYAEMSATMLVAFVIYVAFAAFAHEMIVGIAAMHSGWFPAFAVALITLIIGMLIGFPPVALAMLCGFSAATGPAFADMGYDLKAGYILRGNGADPRFELEGRRQQLAAGMLAFIVALPIVYFTYNNFFTRGLIPPVAAVYVATIKAGVAEGVALQLLIWAVPGAIIQFLGGSKRQLGVLLSTGLLIANPLAGWAVIIGIVLRIIALRIWGDKVRNSLEVFAAGTIAGDALFSFFSSMIHAQAKVK
ncbi:OPT/YSL family transporter [Paralcaligenes sp. KSB-10]|uniref:OPT/YSL family transporter n=1 Tax=Paralcaligenes sp. KSB-10 TaxID=2901142 RepID=UPI001E5C2A48|nr:OPT/YSL family transporter [Paralcaligenes sp. KSB-10]UHL63071.1 OPT/YSL family transporter [Paralcaligenes sp. KSB-10]